MRISYLIFLGFTFILILFATTTYINFQQSEKVKENSEFLSTSTLIVRSSNRFQRNILNTRSGLRGYLLTGEPYFLQAYDSSNLENKTILKELFDAFPDTSRQEKLLAEIDMLNSRWLADFATPLRQAKISAETSAAYEPYFNKLHKELTRSGRERELNVQLNDRLREFINLEYDRREDQKILLYNSVQQTRIISFMLTSVSVVIGLIIVSFITYRISRRILKMVNMADSIAAGNYEVYTEDTGRDELSHLARSLNRMARVLSSTIAELKQKNAELDQFAHIVSHDMKAPLRGIDNVVSWIEEDHKEELSPRVGEYMDLIKGRVTRGENLIQGLLSYARVGKEEAEKESVDVAELINEVMENYLGNTGVRLILRPGLPVLYTERLPLLQVFSNLISNAIKYHDKKDGLIEIYHEETEDRYEFFVRDNGPGISKTYHEKIFVIFQTLQERDSFESTGVGLAIVKKILNSRNEKIRLVSEPGAGSTFSFTWKKH
ncbi:MAG TPA: ATP-binding protein [Flavisolibacter sp.]|nr:ATP-binding protein [Flavisolibacter sp.]